VAKGAKERESSTLDKIKEKAKEWGDKTSPRKGDAIGGVRGITN